MSQLVPSSLPVIDCVGTLVEPPRTAPVAAPPRIIHTAFEPLWPAVLGLIYLGGWAYLVLWVMAGAA